ncbi:MAG: low molecular weight protein arginine phosphatase [Syntrophomonas sp.]|uniref:low molecular weight protein arginine phosphatase n=1 Tax=Syntrophomonas sp. TaxID=2053627 RepID=UPI002608E436|nr:low molecular weight protein arginine phosphatase [Syntrophomonas sp.]MDD2509529.1 low molecular weight protein arginine phosphatase [Syntrophomonas sp.]MDD3878400.1 low molecular weight protein arginine phosphatase [Syntrophomonas sp.]MDD4625501.1 low molecular weight protein arginine phosphatase [Syntrophomonas sp.]
MKRILFACTGNTCRSPMAQALFSKIIRETQLDSDFEVLSAGIFAYPACPASPEAVEVLRQEEIDISQHLSLPLSDDLLEDAHLILSMTISQRNYLQEIFPLKRDCIFSLAEFAGLGELDIIDPIGMGREAYLDTLQQLKTILPQVLKEILQRKSAGGI